MKPTKMPGFKADFSLYQARHFRYAAHGDATTLAGEVLPQLPRRPGGSPSCESQCFLAGRSALECWLRCDPYSSPHWVFV